ncbi:hypothetical protein P8605_24290 [Streptomyces sp. T-3]|nr:hypothetical protein [Streptomyces sp. T-3]
MKALLWVLLVVSALFNVSTHFMWEGAQTLVMTLSAVAFLGCAVGLWLLRDRKSARTTESR